MSTPAAPEKIEALRALIEAEQAEALARRAPNVEPPKVKIVHGRRWIKVDVGTSGKYMVDTDGAIYGIKGYGVPHLGHQYGTLDTIQEWDWSGYTAVRVAA